MAATEALMVGRPIVVAGDPEGNARDVVNDEQGVLVPLENARDPERILSALETCLHRTYDSQEIRAFAVDRYGEDQLREREAQRYRWLASGSATRKAAIRQSLARIMLQTKLPWRLVNRLLEV